MFVLNVAPTGYHAKPLKCLQVGGFLGDPAWVCRCSHGNAQSIPVVFWWIFSKSCNFSNLLLDYVGLATFFRDCGNVLRWLAAPFGVAPSIPVFLDIFRFGLVCRGNGASIPATFWFFYFIVDASISAQPLLGVAPCIPRFWGLVGFTGVHTGIEHLFPVCFGVDPPLSAFPFIYIYPIRFKALLTVRLHIYSDIFWPWSSWRAGTHTQELVRSIVAVGLFPFWALFARLFNSNWMALSQVVAPSIIHYSICFSPSKLDFNRPSPKPFPERRILNGGLFFWWLFLFRVGHVFLISVSVFLCFSAFCFSAFCFSAFPCFFAFIVLWIFASPLFCFFASSLLCFSTVLPLCFSASPLFCFSMLFCLSSFSASMLSAFPCFSAFPASLLTCFSDFLLFPPFLFLILQIILKKHHVNKP